MKLEKPKGRVYNFLTRAYYSIMVVMAFVVLVLLIVKRLHDCKIFATCNLL